ncbi:hypothetical protein [Enhygromyxa salina]|uniref:hypothetical protein n=1 Tax=Enhygromyxa salina TaxID=215803 RepID=UPI000D0357C6|nr:hypothetical protein [Enhygromyxa salina]
MTALHRLRLHVFAFVVALLTGLACDISLPTTIPTSIDGAAKSVACPEWGSGNVIGASFTGDAALNAQIAAFVQASMDIERVANQAYANVTAACVKMGKDLGVSAAELQGSAADSASAPCNAVAAKIDAIVKANAAIKVSYQPPRCQMDANFKASCDAECGLEVDPGKVVAECEPAKLSGYCQGTCTGQCEGTCTGECQGECSAKDAQGRCVGECKGTCSGSCDATCHAKCDGTWKAPRCDVEVEQSKVKADCAANCEASAKFRASCQPPKLDVTTSAQAEAMTKLVATLKANLPALIQAQLRLSKQLAGDIKVVIDSGAKLKGQLSGAGSKAVACVTAAVGAMAQASVKINVSVKASASVSGKAGASASGGA